MAVSFAALRGMVWKGAWVEEKAPIRLNQRQSKLPKGWQGIWREAGRSVADFGERIRKTFPWCSRVASAPEEQRFFYEEREYLLALLGC